MKFKPFTKVEMKMLVYNKVKNGLTYTDAIKQLNTEIGEMKTLYLKQQGLEKDFFE